MLHLDDDKKKAHYVTDFAVTQIPSDLKVLCECPAMHLLFDQLPTARAVSQRLSSQGVSN